MLMQEKTNIMTTAFVLKTFGIARLDVSGAHSSVPDCGLMKAAF